MISVVIPVYNNAPTLSSLTQRIDTALGRSAYEIIFIEDGSKDDSLDIIESLAISNPNVRLISFSRNFGQHAAISAGFAKATGQHVVLMDADLQDEPEHIPELISKLNENFDICLTVKSEPHRNFALKAPSILFHSIFALITGQKYPRNLGTFRAFNKSVLNALDGFQEYRPIYGPLMNIIGFRKTFISVERPPRAVGTTSYSFLRRLKMAIDILISYTNLPHVISVVVGVTLLTVSCGYGSIVLLGYIAFDQRLPPGLNLFLMVNLLMFGGVFVSLGIIGTYLFRVYQEVLCRPRYIIRKQINFSETEL